MIISVHALHCSPCTVNYILSLTINNIIIDEINLMNLLILYTMVVVQYFSVILKTYGLVFFS